MAAGLPAASLDRRLLLRKRVVTPNSLNEEVETFTDLARVWTSRMDVSDAEKVRAQQVGAEITTRFQIRWASAWASLNPKDRCVCEDREYEITAVKELGRRVGMEITACARADQDNLYT